MYRYVVSTKDGQVLKGVSKQTSRDAAVRELQAAGYVVVSIDRGSSRVSLGDLFTNMSGSVRHIDKVLITKHLALMLRSGLTITESLRILEDQSSSPKLRLILGRIAQHVDGGGSFSDGLAAHPKVFSHFYVNIVRAGEVSGTLEDNLTHLAEQFTKEHELMMKVRSALLYPVIVLVLALVIGFFFAAFVLPQVANLFVGLQGIKLPAVTVAMLRIAAFTKVHAGSTFLGIVAAILLVNWFIRLKFMRPSTHWLILHLPIVGGIAKNVNLARFALVFGTMLRSGVTITRSLEVTGEVLGNIHYQRAVSRALEDIQSGRTLTEGLGRSPDLFPKITTRMANVGERSGKLEEVLGYLADFYQLEVDSVMRNLSSILEPVLLGIIGCLAMLIAYAIIIPIYDFIGVLGRIGG